MGEDGLDITWSLFQTTIGLTMRYFGDCSLQETRLSGFRSPMEFFDFHRLSRPADFNTAVSVSLALVGMSSLLLTDGLAVLPDYSAYRTTLDIFRVRETCVIGRVTLGG